MAGAKRVLIVDDDVHIREFIRLTLGPEYDVLEAPDGAAALAVVQEQPPDLILLDMRMPVMDGWEFARRYRALPRPHAPILVLTAARDAAAWSAEVEANAVLAKPFDLDDLMALVGQYTREPQQEAPLPE